MEEVGKIESFQLDKLMKLKKGTKVNLVLSGGGQKGIAHIALIEKLEELKIKINAISGASVGALVGAMYCSGIKCKDIYNFFEDTPLFQYSWINVNKPGVFNAENYSKLIKDMVSINFEDLKIPLYLVATNLGQGISTYFNKGKLHQPLLASCAVPAVFNPVEIDNELYSDGGIMDNFPIYPFLNDKHPIIGSYVSLPENKSNKSLNSILRVSLRASDLLSLAIEREKFQKTYYTAFFPVSKHRPLDKSGVNKIYNKAKCFISGIEYVEENEKSRYSGIKLPNIKLPNISRGTKE